MQVLEWSYEKAINGVAGLDSASELAQSYTQSDKDRSGQANSLIRWQNTKAGTSGFLSGLGGILTMPVTIPANVASVIFVQMRMIAAIAHIGGHDIRDDRVNFYFDLDRKRNTSETKTFTVLLNAAYLGTYYLPGIQVEAMYDNDYLVRTKGNWIEVVK